MKLAHRRSSFPLFALMSVTIAVLAALVMLTMAGGDTHAQSSVPAAPTGLTSTSVSHDSVTLSWDDPGDASITGYLVLRRDVVNQAPGTFSTVESNTGSTATTYTDSTVAAETRYAYRVKAINSEGTSEQSNYVNVETPAAPTPSVPEQPTGLAATSVSHDGVTLSWDDPGDNTITSYQVLRRDVASDPPGTFKVIEDDTGSAATTHTDASVKPDTGYAYRVRARSADGLSEQSKRVDVETPPLDSRIPRQTRSTDATLSAISVDGTAMPGFASDRTSYEYGAASTVTRATVSATTTDTNATVSITPEDADGGTGGHQVDLSAGRNAVTVTVTAEDGITTLDYTVSVNRGVTALTGWKVADDLDGLIAAGNDSPQGIWSDGATMWVADFSGGKLYAYRLSDGARDSAKDFDTLSAAGNGSPTGIWSDGATMWVADFYGSKVYAYRMSDGARDSAKDFDTLSAAGNEHPVNIWSDGTTMWVSDWVDDDLYAYRMSDKTRDPDRDFDTLRAAGNDFRTGIWSDGTTMWAADWSGAKLYAYRMSDKARDPARDFDTLGAAGNNNARGIWSDGTTMWVVDVRDDKVYAYNRAPGDDELLSVLAFSPRDIIGFDPGRASYEVGVASNVTQATVSATAVATVSIAPEDADDVKGGHQVDLSAGRNAVTVTVTAEDGVLTLDYTVSVNRGVTDLTGWKAADDLDGLIAAGNNSPTGIWSDGATMWVADLSGGKLYAYRLSDGGRDSDKDFDTLSAAGNVKPVGIWSDGTTMWVADEYEDKLYAYRMSDKTRDPDRDFDTLKAAGNNNARGIWSDGTTMWVADRFYNTLYAYRMSDKTRDPDRDFETFETLRAAGNMNPVGIWSDGTTMWVADRVDNKLYAYRMSDKERDPGRDFDALPAADNNNAYGIWSDGTTMWVVDVSDDKVYSYIADDRAIVFAPTSLTVERGDTTGATYTVKLATEPTENVMVTVSGQSGTDLILEGLSPTNTLTFTTSNWDTAQAVTVKAAVDADGTDDTVTLAHAATGGNYAGVSADLKVAVTAPVGHLAAELTPAPDVGTFPMISGYSDYGKLGNLAPYGWQIDGTQYTVKFLFHSSGGLVLGMEQQLSTDFTLHVGSASYRASESMVPTAMVEAGYWWPLAVPGWSVGEPIQIKLAIHRGEPLGERPPAPVTGYFRNHPPEHDGREEFTFRLHFSEGVDTTADALRDHVLSVAGGTVSGVENIRGEGKIWSVSVTPGSRDTITIGIEPDLDCEVSGAICAADGRRLHNRMELSVPMMSNTPPTGVPTVSGVVEVGETLTADTSDIADADGMTGATFSYQWIADAADIGGSTGSTYTLLDADEGKAIRVRVSFTDDGGNDETLTSVATPPVSAPVSAALTAEFLDVPSTHDGQTAFTFELRFSEEFELSYVTLRDHAFSVTGGEVTRARRLERDSATPNIRWEITVIPSGGGDVTIVLPETSDCEDDGAICTENGRKLQQSVTATVPRR